MYDIAKLKERHRRDLARLSFDEKIAVLIRMQKITREMALAAGRKFNGVVWGERESEAKAFRQPTTKLKEEEVQMTQINLQYISDEKGVPTAVIVPIELWREIASEKETAYLLKSKRMKKRLFEAKNRRKGIPFEEALEKLGI